MITKLNSYVTQLRTSAAIATSAPIFTNFHREPEILDPPLFAGDLSKARAWIMDMRLKLTADTQFFCTEQAKMIYINSRLEGPVKQQIHPFIRRPYL